MFPQHVWTFLSLFCSKFEVHFDLDFASSWQYNLWKSLTTCNFAFVYVLMCACLSPPVCFFFFGDCRVSVWNFTTCNVCCPCPHINHHIMLNTDGVTNQCKTTPRCKTCTFAKAKQSALIQSSCIKLYTFIDTSQLNTYEFHQDLCIIPWCDCMWARYCPQKDVWEESHKKRIN